MSKGKFKRKRDQRLLFMDDVREEEKKDDVEEEEKIEEQKSKETPPAKPKEETPPTSQQKMFTKEDVSAAIKDGIASYVAAEDQKKKEQEAADKNDYKALYEEQKNKLDKLEEKINAGSTYEKRINDMVDSTIKNWPASIKKTDPGKDSVDLRVAWMESHTDVVKELLASKNVQQEHGGGRGSGGTQPSEVAKTYMGNVYSVPDSLQPKGN